MTIKRTEYRDNIQVKPGSRTITRSQMEAKPSKRSATILTVPGHAIADVQDDVRIDRITKHFGQTLEDAVSGGGGCGCDRCGGLTVAGRQH